MKIPSTKNFSFLQGGGEMGDLTRNHNWSTTSLGSPGEWPQSLRSYLSLLLNSRFPMFLFWGPESICFYNDAYRLSLGDNGKHPAILGMPGKDAWPEIWHFIGPMINEILAGGEATWYEDQFLPIYRNGRMEDVYWTFSYSPVSDDSGNTAGVFVTCTETTNSFKSLRRIEESESRFRKLIQEAPVAIGLFLGRDLIIDTPNEAFINVIGRGPDITGKRLAEVMPELESQPFLQLLDDVFTSGKPYRINEARLLIERDGLALTRYFNVTFLPITNETGSVASILDISVDVTEQVVARQKVEQSEARFRSLIQEAPVGTCLYVGNELRIEVANKIILGYWGKGKEAIGKTMLEAMPELVEQPFPKILQSVFTTGKTYEQKGARADLVVDGILGTYYFDFTYKPLFDVDGKVYGILDIAIDVTEQVVARLKLEEAEASLRGAVDLAQLGTWSIDVATNGLTYSDRLIEWFGFDPKDQVYTQVIPILQEGDQERIQSAVAWALNPASNGIYDEIYTVIHPTTGRKRILHAQGKTVFDVAGKAVRLNGTAQDITIQQELQLALEEEVQKRTEELAEANKALQQNNAELEQFAYIASHDLQEPLRKVSTFTEMLKNNLGKVDDRSENYLNKISASALRMMQLIRDVLDFSQLSNKQHFFDKVDLGAVVEGLMADFELIIEQKGAVINCHHLPQLIANPLQMRQLFGNLLSNALKFTRKGVAPVITIASQLLAKDEQMKYPGLLADKDYLLINVSDNGIGFSEEHAEKIFSIFQRLHGKGDFAGTGIGLALCKKIVQNHQGEIWATSRTENGAMFHIILPANGVN